ncbi:MAG: hypothetical protein Lm2023SU_31300 [Serratia ureilytica]
MSRFWANQNAGEIGGWVELRPPGCRGISEDLTAALSDLTHFLKRPTRLNFAKHCK